MSYVSLMFLETSKGETHRLSLKFLPFSTSSDGPANSQECDLRRRRVPAQGNTHCPFAKHQLRDQGKEFEIQESLTCARFRRSIIGVYKVEDPRAQQKFNEAKQGLARTHEEVTVTHLKADLLWAEILLPTVFLARAPVVFPWSTYHVWMHRCLTLDGTCIL